jgi:hypothetical protein
VRSPWPQLTADQAVTVFLSRVDTEEQLCYDSDIGDVRSPEPENLGQRAREVFSFTGHQALAVLSQSRVPD